MEKRKPKKIILSISLQQKMLDFFMKTSIPRIIQMKKKDNNRA